ncbi:hypothetical protein GTP27_15945 [Pseudoduganella sp. CY13W]|uniref:Uncharacterized protein n=2 Tax=Duganella qianjiadongensis TaxID=2692176 RepID=A0ABW9VMV9_9BURK|nr:hypothetical protein [Duganella qianjiadongensis]
MLRPRAVPGCGLTLCLSVLLLAGSAAHARADREAANKLQQREASEAERSSFDAYYRALALSEAHGARPVAPLFAPAFDITRRSKQPWQVIARVDSAPRHSAVDLCRQIRSSFIYDASARTGTRWQPAAQPPTWHVWLARPNTICSAAPHTVLMAPALPPEDVVALLRQHAELLQRARLLLAGNSQCIRQRALPFTLAAIEPAAAADGATRMFALLFDSDRATRVRVAVRKHRGEYAAWNVSCD